MLTGHSNFSARLGCSVLYNHTNNIYSGSEYQKANEVSALPKPTPQQLTRGYIGNIIILEFSAASAVWIAMVLKPYRKPSILIHTLLETQGDNCTQWAQVQAVVKTMETRATVYK